MQIITHMLTQYSVRRENCIIDQFWEAMLTIFWSGSRFRDVQEYAALLDYLKASFDFLQCPEPELSVFLYAERCATSIRRFQRETSIEINHPTTRKFSKLNSGTHENEEIMFPIFKLFEDKVPYFHIVDANQSIESVTTSILKLL